MLLSSLIERNGNFCADSWLMSWGMALEKDYPLLHKDGHNVYTPTLTGLDERSHLAARDWIGHSCS